MLTDIAQSPISETIRKLSAERRSGDLQVTAAPLATHGLALAAGATLYVAASNLVPEFQNKRRMDLTLSFFGGAAAVILLEMWK